MTARKDGLPQNRKPRSTPLAKDEPRMQRFLDRLQLCGNWAQAAKETDHANSHWTASTYRQLAERDPTGFGLRCKHALDLFYASLEQEAVRRARDGVATPARYQGEVVGFDQVYSDGLLTKILTSRIPETYGERKDINLNIAVQPVGIWSITAEQAERIKREAPEIGKQLESVLRWIIADNKRLAGHQREAVKLLTHDDGVIDVESTSVESTIRVADGADIHDGLSEAELTELREFNGVTE